MWNQIPYSEEHLKEILDITAEYYGKEAEIADEGFIRHEYFNNPSGNPTIHLAYDSQVNRLAGQYVVIAQRVSVNTVLYPAILSLNTLTKVEYRGQGIFTGLAKSVYEENIQKKTVFCYGAPNQNSHHGFVKKLGFRDIGIIPLYLNFLDFPTLVKDKTKSRFLAACARPFNLSVKNTGAKNADQTETIVITHKNVSLFDAYWEKIKNKYPVMVVRDSLFCKWRYLDTPLRDYHILMALRKGVPCGYIIGRITEVAGMRCGMIVDFLVDRGCDDIGNMLIQKARSYFKDCQAGLSGCLMQSFTEEASMLRKNRYFRCPRFLEPQPFPIIFRQFHDIPENSVLNDFNNWFFTMGDYDVI